MATQHQPLALSVWCLMSHWLLCCSQTLHYIHDRYSAPAIIITENGVDVPNEAAAPYSTDDQFRISYIQGYLQQVTFCSYNMKINWKNVLHVYGCMQLHQASYYASCAYCCRRMLAGWLTGALAANAYKPHHTNNRCMLASYTIPVPDARLQLHCTSPEYMLASYTMPGSHGTTWYQMSLLPMAAGSGCKRRWREPSGLLLLELVGQLWCALQAPPLTCPTHVTHILCWHLYYLL